MKGVSQIGDHTGKAHGRGRGGWRGGARKTESWAGIQPRRALESCQKFHLPYHAQWGALTQGRGRWEAGWIHLLNLLHGARMLGPEWLGKTMQAAMAWPRCEPRHSFSCIILMGQKRGCWGGEPGWGSFGECVCTECSEHQTLLRLHPPCWPLIRTPHPNPDTLLCPPSLPGVFLQWWHLCEHQWL